MTNKLEVMNLFQFDVEIWGTVSDWIMIFVTAFTAIYLVKTFKQQNKALEIERYRFTMSIRPSFSTKLNLYKPIVSIDEVNKIKVNLEIKIENHRALMERIEVQVSNIVTFENLYIPFAGSRWMEVGALWNIPFIFFEKEKIGDNFVPISPSIYIYFRDIEQRLFKQLIFLQTKPELKLYLHPPEELVENKQ